MQIILDENNNANCTSDVDDVQKVTKEEDNLIAKLKQFMLQQEMIERRLKEEKNCEKQIANDKQPKQSVQSLQKESHTSQLLEEMELGCDKQVHQIENMAMHTGTLDLGDRTVEHINEKNDLQVKEQNDKQSEQQNGHQQDGHQKDKNQQDEHQQDEHQQDEPQKDEPQKDEHQKDEPQQDKLQQNEHQQNEHQQNEHQQNEHQQNEHQQFNGDKSDIKKEKAEFSAEKMAQIGTTVTAVQVKVIIEEVEDLLDSDSSISEQISECSAPKNYQATAGVIETDLDDTIDAIQPESIENMEKDVDKLLEEKNKKIPDDVNNGKALIVSDVEVVKTDVIPQKMEKQPVKTEMTSKVNDKRVDITKNYLISLLKDENNNDKPVVPDQTSVPEIELIIRASTIDGRRKGACLFCQEYFMDLYLLAELNYISLKVSTVDLKKPPRDFRSKFDCIAPPILLDKKGRDQRAILENERIERYIMKNIPGGHSLFVSDRKTATLIENLYSKFKLALARNEPHTKNSLIRHLESINIHLKERGTKYLTDDHISCFDCELMTRLQHIRVAGTYFITDFKIPYEFKYLWRYMKNMYSLNAFIQSCPADQDIISHYFNSSTMTCKNAMSKNRAHLELQAPAYNISIPEEIVFD